MWDDRETIAGQSIHFDLSNQANGATLGHAAATHPLTREQADAIVNSESGLFTAQSSDNTAGVLDAQGGAGGPIPLSRQQFYIGINDVLNPGFDRRALTLFDAWRNLPSSGRDPYTDAREAIARGQEIFNTRIKGHSISPDGDFRISREVFRRRRWARARHASRSKRATRAMFVSRMAGT
jgi:cytochrome c peroxidase